MNIFTTMQRLQSVSASDLQAFLGAPEQLLQQPVELQLAVASFVDTPRSLLEVLVNSASVEVAEAASLHVNWAGEITNDWQRAVDEILEERQMGQNDRLAVELLKVGAVPPCFLSKWVPADRLIQGLRNPYMPLRYRLQLLERLAQEPTLEPRLQVAEAPETPLAILEQLAGDLELPVRLAVKFNPSCPPQLIELIEGQHAVASNWNTGREELAMLGQSRWAWIRLAVAQNPNASAETLMGLAQDAVYKIRLAVAKNPATAADVLTVLAEHPDKTIQQTVAEHPNASEELLHQVFPTQKHILKKRNNLPASILERYFNEAPSEQPIWKNNELRYLFLRQPNTPTWILAELANVDLEALRADILANQSSRPSPEVFKKWIEDDIRFLVDVAEHPQVSALKNPNFPPLERYRLQLLMEEEKETANFHQLMAHRPDSPYALSQVVEKGNQQAKLIAARSNKTPINILEQLAKDSDKIVRQVVSENSNLPLSTLLELARDPSINVRLCLGYKNTNKKTSTPIQLLEILAQDASEEVRAKVAEHPDTPVEILIRLANDSSREVKGKLTGNPNTPVTILTRLGLEENLVNVRNPNTPGSVLAQAIRTMSSESIAKFIKHAVKGSQMPVETLTQLASHTDGSVRYRVACHPNTPATVLRQLARDSYVATVRAVAGNANTSPETLEVLATHPDFTTCLDVVRNPNTPSHVLNQIVLSTKTSANLPNKTIDMLKSALPGNHNDLLREIACNPRTPLEALEIIARREFVSATPNPNSIIPPRTDDDIVRALAYNPNLTPELLAILTQDPCVDVRVCLIRHPNLTETLWLRLASDAAVSVREAVASSPEAPVNILELLAQDEQAEVRAKVATNLNTSITTLEVLATDSNSNVRTAVASNSNLLATTLEQLANDEKVEVRRAVAQNSNTPAFIRETLRDLVLQPTTRQISTTLRGLTRIYNPSTDDLPTILTEYTQSENAFVRFITLLHPLTPQDILNQGALSASWLERYAVADNPATSTQIKQQLTQDSNRIVRAAVIANL